MQKASAACRLRLWKRWQRGQGRFTGASVQKVSWCGYPRRDCSPKSHLCHSSLRKRRGHQDRVWKPSWACEVKRLWGAAMCSVCWVTSQRVVRLCGAGGVEGALYRFWHTCLTSHCGRCQCVPQPTLGLGTWPAWMCALTVRTMLVGPGSARSGQMQWRPGVPGGWCPLLQKNGSPGAIGVTGHPAYHNAALLQHCRSQRRGRLTNFAAICVSSWQLAQAG